MAQSLEELAASIQKDIGWMVDCFKPRLAYWDSFYDLFTDKEEGFHEAVLPMPKIEDIVSAQPMTETIEPRYPLEFININFTLSEDTGIDPRAA